MKKIFTLLIGIICSVTIIYAQDAPPQAFSYQAVIMKANGNAVLSNTTISLRISILQGSTIGVPVYIETDHPTTDSNGQINIVIGESTGLPYIDWSNGSYFLKTEVDIKGGTNYQVLSTTQLLSVPYALYAGSGDYNNLLNKPALFDGTWSSLTGKPTFATVATSGSYNDLSNRPITDGSETRLTAGTNVNVTGSGTTASPYVINSNGYGNTDAVTITGDQTIAGIKTFSDKIIATQEGIGISTPNASAALEISSTTQGFLPPRMTQAERDAITPIEGLIVYNTTTKKPNYYNGLEWINYDGTSAEIIAIGSHYQGGIVAYILQSGDPGYDANVLHGLIAAPSAQSTGIQWDNGTYTTTGATLTALGTGNANTVFIVSNQGAGSYAAKLCYDLVLNGYNDWYLPSKDELNKLYLNKGAIGGFVSTDYWSSTEFGNNYAWNQSFYSGDQGYYFKSYAAYVRAVRAF